MKTRWSLWAAAIAAVLMMQLESSESANILAVFPFCTRSHNNVYSTITKALASRGHTFTVITSQPLASPPPNYKQIDVYSLVERHLNVFTSTEKKIGVLSLFSKLKDMTDDICRSVLYHPEVQKLMHQNPPEKFDLILMTNFFGECFYGIAHIYKVPMILISPAGQMPTTYGTTGNIVLPSAVANAVLGFDDRMTFPQRIVNTLTSVGFFTYYYHYILPNMYSVMKEVFGEDIPKISELENYVSLALLNHHFSLNGAHPLVPNLIEVGGLHVKPPQELPKELKQFLDGAGKDGVIYFSLGSVLKSANLPTETRDEFIAAFSELKQRVLWKWEGESPLPGQPKNLRLEKWLPQQDLLAHPNVKLFITHGGLLSFQEATNRGVPLIGIPYFADQGTNMQKVVNLKLGTKLDAANLTKENILNAINEVLGNPVYSTNMKNIHKIIADQRDHPLDRAVYWVEYVLRHKGAKHLRPAAADLRWYQLYMFDIFFVLMVIPLVVFIAISYVMIKLMKKLCKSKKKPENSSKKNQ
ncbi:UDP-glycosyltransferase [Ladona fulva]|uniref:UDP-glycosyltransferase n=1 Tax=Ladona fulva TaxID=123851 RepID=A0A8K0K9Q9_LADFU|nr:UDP-glycosyltransferase [Ladona fulva]